MGALVVKPIAAINAAPNTSPPAIALGAPIRSAKDPSIGWGNDVLIENMATIKAAVVLAISRRSASIGSNAGNMLVSASLTRWASATVTAAVIEWCCFMAVVAVKKGSRSAPRYIGGGGIVKSLDNRGRGYTRLGR